ncbi:MAG: glycoside hydrolase [Bacteroidia bacterium]|nr:glycoside hydrolase [Bacteroidia bacterium]
MPLDNLLSQAHKVLETNWRDGFTIPTDKLYPFQWNWDSGFICLGHQFMDIGKAIQEMNSLFSGQWENGLLPHIIFHSENEKTYFPNFDFWETEVNPGAPTKPKSSGITQPPVHGFILENLLRNNPQNEEILAFANYMFDKILNYHRFLYTYRDPFSEGLMYIFHPWESGRDNSPLWDESLNRIHIKEGELPQYHRRDTYLADPAERPTSAQYDRYVYLLLLGKKYQYDGLEIAEESPLLIQDDMMNAILIKANEALIKVGKQLRKDTAEIEEWQSQSLYSFREKLWNEELGMFTSYDLRSGEQIKHKEIGGIIPVFAGIPDSQQAEKINQYLSELHDRGYYLTPSFDVDSQLFDSKRYWRGPVWPHMNWMIFHGLNDYGFKDTAAIVKSDTFEIVEKFGFFEYYEPDKALAAKLVRGYGGGLFSWTASSIIDLIHSS